MKYQLEFFQDEESPMNLLRDEVKEIRGSAEKVRKSMFAKHGELYKQYMELHARLQIIERHICTQIPMKCELASI